MRPARSLLLLLLLCHALPAAATRVVAFNPEGHVKKVREVRATFDAPVVAFGDMNAPAPFDVACAHPGKGRWADATNWVHTFDREAPSGLACTFTLRPGLKDAAGAAVEAHAPFRFDTGGPAVLRVQPAEDSYAIDENQIFLLRLDAPASPAAIERGAYCAADGIGEKIPVRVIEGKERDALFEQNRAFAAAAVIGEGRARGEPVKGKPALDPTRLASVPLVALQCRRTLPNGRAVKLVWSRDIAGPGGLRSAEDQVMSFRTRSEFKATFSCERTGRGTPCIPFLAMRLDFSAPIPAAVAAAITLTGGGRIHKATPEEESAGRVHAVVFKPPFQEQAQLRLQLPPGVADVAGRALVNAPSFPLAVRTGVAPPLVKFPARFGILEARGDRMLPVTVRNVESELAGRVVDGERVGGKLVRVGASEDEKVIAWMRRLSGARADGPWDPAEQYGDALAKPLLAATDGASAFALPKPNGRRAFEVIGIPLKEPGFYVVELASPRLGAAINRRGAPAYVSAAALVTNLAAHLKRGAESSLVWVTTLDKAAPVNGAQVTVRDCKGKALWQGRTGKDGVARIAQPLESAQCRGDRLFVSARRGADMTFTLSEWNRGIEPYRFNVNTLYGRAPQRIARTVFDRTLLRAGETVHMKHFLRRQTGEGFAFPGPAEAKPDPLATLTIAHAGSDQRYELPLSWRADGSAAIDWAIPADAALGTYTVQIGPYDAGTFRVEAFRVPTMKAVLLGPKRPVLDGQAVTLDAQVGYLAGGAAADMPVRLRTMTERAAPDYPAYEGYTFAGADVREGRSNETSRIEDDGYYEDEESGEEGAVSRAGVRTQAAKLDRNGALRLTLEPSKVPEPSRMTAELEFRDANGEAGTVSTSVALWPSALVVGLKPDGWAMSKDRFKVHAIVLNVDGTPAANADVAVDFYKRDYYTHRRRLLGGFYSYESYTEVKKLGAACSGRTDAQGRLECAAAAPASGNLILRAQTRDADGRAAASTIDVWVAGSEDWWFRGSDSDRIDLLPEKKAYEPGQHATFQARIPFREATALITVEREGVLDAYVRRLSGKQPAFTVPIRESYAPNVFVSAFVVRGRAGGIAPTALVDLGKPAFKMGLTPLRVGWAGNTLDVAVETDKQVYRTREKALVRVKVTRPDGGALPPGAEVAVAAVDAGLLELRPNDSWKLLEAMMTERGLQVTTATPQMQVVGKRHFGRKAVPHGGGGGRSAGRELFDTLLYWNPRVAVGADGTAQVEVPLNDSLTAFRIVAVATAGAGRFGTGEREIRSTQDLIVTSGLPQIVRNGDVLRAGFTVRNTTDRSLALQASAQFGVEGKQQHLSALPLTLAPGEAREIAWDVTVPAAGDSVRWDVSVSGAGAADRMRVTQQVVPAVPVRTVQATLLQLDGPQSMPVAAPAGGLPGVGGVQTRLSASIAGGLGAVRAYMEQYPYTCFEQLGSKALALQDRAAWERHMKQLPAHLDGDGLLMYFPGMLYGSDVLTAYIVSAADEVGYAIPEDGKRRMLDALAAFVEGRITRYSAVRAADLAVRKLAALEALSRAGRVTPAMLASLTVTPEQWPTSAVLDWYLVQRRGALPDRDAHLRRAEQILRTRLHFQGTTMNFSTEAQDRLWWLMVSGDTNASRLVLAVLGQPEWRGDMGRLVRGMLARQEKGRWDTTVANVWGTLAVTKFAAAFESEAVSGATTVATGADSRTVAWPQAGDAPLLQPWPAGAATWRAQHAGPGKPWATIRSLAAVPLGAPAFSGYRIARTVTPVEQSKPGAWTRGDVYRVKLELEAQADMTWVVVEDPVPAGATILGSGLGRDSAMLANDGSMPQGAWPAFQERRADVFRAYYAFVPRGPWSVEYTVRLNGAGRFALPPTRVEAMYAPEMFGALPNQALHVAP